MTSLRATSEVRHLTLLPPLDGLAHRRGKAAVPPPSAVVALVWGGEPSSSAHRLPSHITERFWSKVEIARPDECWLWTAGKDNYGYGTFCVKYPRKVKAHRFAYESLIGPIPDGLVIDHLCRVRDCCNPAHMEPVTNRENVLRGTGNSAENARKAHCKRGHALVGDNLYFNRSNGTRHCRECRNARDRARYHRERAEAASRPCEVCDMPVPDYGCPACGGDEAA